MEKKLDQKGCRGPVLMDLSNAFDTLNHDLLLAKLYANGFDKDSLKVHHRYVSNRYQALQLFSDILFASIRCLKLTMPLVLSSPIQ